MHEDLLAQGVDLTGIKFWKLSLTNNGDPVYLRSWGQKKSEGNRRYWGIGSGFEFVAHQNETLYSKDNVYILHVGADRSQRLPIRVDKTALPASWDEGSEVSHYNETYTFEPDSIYLTLSPNGDPWAGGIITSQSTDISFALPLNLTDYAVGQGPTEVSMDVWGYTTGAHHAELSHAGQTLDSQWFSGINAATLRGVIASNSLPQGSTFDFTMAGSGVIDQLAIDKYEVTYPRKTLSKEGRLVFAASGQVIRLDGFPQGWIRIMREDIATGELKFVASSTMSKTKQNDNTWTIKFAGTVDPANYYVTLLEMNIFYNLVLNYRLNKMI